MGTRVYYAGEMLTKEHEAEVRSRPGFDVMIEDEVLVEVDDQPAPPVVEEPVAEEPIPFEPEVEGPDEAEVVEEESFPCDFCDYVGKSAHALKIHLGRMH